MIVYIPAVQGLEPRASEKALAAFLVKIGIVYSTGDKPEYL